MPLQLMTADYMKLHTVIPLGYSDHSDMEIGRFVIDVKGRPKQEQKSWRLWKQNFDYKGINTLIFVEGNFKEWRILGWMYMKDALKYPLEEHRKGRMWRTIPPREYRPIEELYALTQASKILEMIRNAD